MEYQKIVDALQKNQGASVASRPTSDVEVEWSDGEVSMARPWLETFNAAPANISPRHFEPGRVVRVVSYNPYESPFAEGRKVYEEITT